MNQHIGSTSVTSRYPEFKVSGGYSARATPDPIPNSEVKPRSADGTVQETVWESRSLPEVMGPTRYKASWGPFFCPYDEGNGIR